MTKTLKDLKSSLQPGDSIAIELAATVISADGTRADRYSIIADPQIGSTPPPGQLRITNLYVDGITKKLVVEYDDSPSI